jgi:hypothetical protein
MGVKAPSGSQHTARHAHWIARHHYWRRTQVQIRLSQRDLHPGRRRDRLTETTEHAAVAAFAPAEIRGSAFGLFAPVQSVGN